MAGLGYKDFTAGAVLTAAQVDGYLMEQSVMNFAGTAARGSALASVLSAGQMAHVGGGTVTVYDGSAWQQVYPASAGLTFVAGTAFSAVASVSVNNCFSATYSTYQLVFVGLGSTGFGLRFRFRVSGADNTDANHTYQLLDVANTSVTALRQSNSTEFQIGVLRPTYSVISTIVANPFASLGKSFVTQFLDVGDPAAASLGIYAGSKNVTTSFTGFSIYSGGTATLTGTIKVYGLKD